LFLGGWHAPFPFLAFIPSYVWFFREVVDLAFRFYLGARDIAAHSRGSDDELGLEVYVADGVHLHHFRCGLAIMPDIV